MLLSSTITYGKHNDESLPLLFFKIKNGEINIDLNNEDHLYYILVLRGTETIPIREKDLNLEKYITAKTKCAEKLKGTIVGINLNNGKYDCAKKEMNIDEADYLCGKFKMIFVSSNKKIFKKIKCAFKGKYKYV